MHSSSPARTPKLQLDIEQPSTGDCWIPPKKKKNPYPRAKEKPQEDGRSVEIMLGIVSYKLALTKSIAND